MLLLLRQNNLKLFVMDEFLKPKQLIQSKNTSNNYSDSYLYFFASVWDFFIALILFLLSIEDKRQNNKE